MSLSTCVVIQTNVWFVSRRYTTGRLPF